MMIAHYTGASTLTEAILGFIHLARSRSLNVGMQEAQEALRAAELGLITNKRAFRYALKAIFCTSEEEAVVFDALFDDYWSGLEDEDERIRYHKTIRYAKQQHGSLAMMGKGKTGEEEDNEAKMVTGASHTERLRRTDFAKVAEIDAEFLEEVITRLAKQLSLRLRKRYQRDKTGVVDIRSTIRHSIGSGGTFLDLVRKYRKKRKTRLIVLLDVSGSMDKYSFYLLRFAWALRSRFSSVETFVFSTTLSKISDAIGERDLAKSMAVLSRHVHHWSSGTRIGDCLKTFNQEYAHRILHGSSVVIVLSDGLDTGDPALLAEQLAKIRRRTKKLIWLNPLKGMEGYEPTARGMRAAMPAIDTFHSAHNLDSLLSLEKFLADV